MNGALKAANLRDIVVHKLSSIDSDSLLPTHTNEVTTNTVQLDYDHSEKERGQADQFSSHASNLRNKVRHTSIVDNPSDFSDEKSIEEQSPTR